MFELPPSEDGNEPMLPSECDLEEEPTEDILSAIDKVDQALPQVKNLEASDSEMDALAELATSSYKDLMDLGMQSDPRYQSEIFSTAGAMLGHAITAKTNKVNKKLKMIELQLKKAALDAKLTSKETQVDATPLGDGKVLDRNELLKILNGKNED